MIQKVISILDTNILVYAFDATSKFHNECTRIIESGDNCCITYNCLWEFYRVMTSQVFQNTITVAQVMDAMNFFDTQLTVLFPSKTTNLILADLIQEYQPKSGRIWDMMVFAQALECNAQRIITKNIKDFPEQDFVLITDPLDYKKTPLKG